MKSKLLLLAIAIFGMIQSMQADVFWGEDSLRYNIIDMVENKCCVVGGRYGNYLVIPNKVRIKNRLFEVTYIDEHAFLGNTKISYIFISDNIQTIKKNSFCVTLSFAHYVNAIKQIDFGRKCGYIGEYAFSDSNVGILVVRNPEPPTLAVSSLGSQLPFNDWTKENGIVYVPDNAIGKYKRHSQWSKFWNIKGLSELSQNKGYMTVDKIKAENEANAAKEKVRTDSIAAAQAELETYRQQLEPRVMSGINFVPFVGAFVKATNKSKLTNIQEISSAHYDLTFEKGKTISDVNFCKTVSGKWADGVVNYQCKYDPIKNIALVLVVRTLVSKNASGEEYENEEQRMFLINNDETHKIEKKLQMELKEKFFSDIKNQNK